MPCELRFLVVWHRDQGCWYEEAHIGVVEGSKQDELTEGRIAGMAIGKVHSSMLAVDSCIVDSTSFSCVHGRNCVVLLVPCFCILCLGVRWIDCVVVVGLD